MCFSQKMWNHFSPQFKVLMVNAMCSMCGGVPKYFIQWKHCLSINNPHNGMLTLPY